jgi:Ca2+-binding EF-hand superfamily protein
MFSGVGQAAFVRDRMMRGLDKDGDQSVSAAEFQALFPKDAAATVEKADAAFKAMDRDGDGKLILKELGPSAMLSADTLNGLLDVSTGVFDRRRFEMRSSDIGLLQSVRQRMLDQLDTDHDGGLSSGELAVPGKNGPGDPAAQSVFAALDSDRSGRLDLAELTGSSLFSMRNLNTFLGGTEDQQEPGTESEHSGDPRTLAAWMVNQADTDGDGTLSLAEYAKIGPQGSFPEGDSVVARSDRSFGMIDGDRDGKLSVDEIANRMVGINASIAGCGVLQAVSPLAVQAQQAGGLDRKALEALSSSSDATAALNDLDTDRDGKLSSAEIHAALSRQLEFYRTGVGRPRVAGTPVDPNGIRRGDQALYTLMRNSQLQLEDLFMKGPSSTSSRKA